MATGDYMGAPVVVDAPVVPTQAIPFRPPPAALVVPIPGRDGTSIEIIDTVPTYEDLPGGLGIEDRGNLWVVAADGLGYPWNGQAFPAEGTGVEIRGPQGKRGVSINGVSVDGSELKISFDDGSTSRVTVPAIQAALDAADAASGSAAGAAGSATAASSAAGAAADSALAAGQSATDAAEDRAQTGLDREATGEDRTATGQHAAAAESARDDALSARDTAQAAASTATTQAGIAKGHATDASASASAAGQSEQAAADHADAASGSATAAAQSATDADTAREAAEQAAADAEQGAPAGGWRKTELHADVQDSLGKADSASQPGHTHSINQVTGLGTALDDKANVGHGHTTEDVDGLQAAIDSAVDALVDGAPGTLDTLAELAAALGDDPDFAATVSARIGARPKTVDVQAWLADKSDTGHKHTATDITDATSTGRGVMTGTAAQGRDALSVPSKTEMRARPAMWIWDGTGTWTAPAGAVDTDTVLNIDTGELHSVEDV